METLADAIIIAGMASLALLWGFCVLGAGLVLRETFSEHVGAIVERFRR